MVVSARRKKKKKRGGREQKCHGHSKSSDGEKKREGEGKIASIAPRKKGKRGKRRIGSPAG